MNFSENLINLRKANDLSQEALAERLGVSRQTIYKWENGVTYPDMDKVVDIAKIFNISIDTLINDGAISDVSKEDIIKKVKSFARGIGLSLLLIMIGVSVLVLMSAFDDDTLSIIGLVLMLVAIFGSILFMVLLGVGFDGFKSQFEPKIEFTKQEKLKEHTSFIKHLILGLGVIFAGIIALIITSITDDDMVMIFGVSVLLVLIGVGLYFLSYGGIMNDFYEHENEFLLSDDKKKKSKLDGLYGIIMIIATIGFFVWGFVWNGWKLSWICFIVGGLLCGIVAIIGESFKNKE